MPSCLCSVRVRGTELGCHVYTPGTFSTEHLCSLIGWGIKDQKCLVEEDKTVTCN